MYAVESGAFDTLQISVSIADQEAIDRVLPKAAARGMGVIVKRPIANAAWRHGKQPPSDWYTRPYWDRLQKLDYDFLKRGGDEAAATRAAIYARHGGRDDGDRRDDARLSESRRISRMPVRGRWGRRSMKRFARDGGRSRLPIGLGSGSSEIHKIFK